MEKEGDPKWLKCKKLWERKLELSEKKTPTTQNRDKDVVVTVNSTQKNSLIFALLCKYIAFNSK